MALAPALAPGTPYNSLRLHVDTTTASSKMPCRRSSFAASSACAPLNVIRSRNSTGAVRPDCARSAPLECSKVLAVARASEESRNLVAVKIHECVAEQHHHEVPTRRASRRARLATATCAKAAGRRHTRNIQNRRRHHHFADPPESPAAPAPGRCAQISPMQPPTLTKPEANVHCSAPARSSASRAGKRQNAAPIPPMGPQHPVLHQAEHA